MVFIIIIVLALIATYLLVSSGVFKKFKWLDSNENEDEDEEPYNIDELESGMMGSFPSDNIDVYDAKKSINIPMEGAINTLIESFKNNANQVYIDFKDNRNSKNYKAYIFDDYKLEILRKNDSLTDDQLNKYFTIRNTVVKDINNIFNYYLDKIKYNENKSYFTLRREILNDKGTKLIINESAMDDITNYILSNTKIPGDIVLLLKYKVSEPAQELIDQVVMLSGYNYPIVLETLEQLMVDREPLPGISLLGVVNSGSATVSNDVTTLTQGFWTRVYYTLKSNNINRYLILYIKLSYMTEQIYRSILSTFVANMQNPKLTEAMNKLTQLCKISKSRIIKTFPYNFAHALIIDAISDNRLMIRNNKSINIDHIDKINSNITNIENYSNIEVNFPVAIQYVKINSQNDMKTISLKDPIYPILSDNYMVNNYLSFPNIKHQGLYFDRDTSLVDSKSGCILIINTSNKDLIIGSFIIYAALQGGTIADDYIDLTDTVLDSNIIKNTAFISIEYGTYNSAIASTESNRFTIDTNKSTAVQTSWLNNESITIPGGKAIRIRASKQITMVNVRYLRIFAILIPFITKPISDFLTINILHDKNNDDNRYNTILITNIPTDMPNLLIPFDSQYNISSSVASSSDTFTIIKKYLPSSGSHSRVLLNSTTNDSLVGTKSPTASNNTVISNYISTPITFQSIQPNTISGMLTDTSKIITDDPNRGRESYRIRIKNIGTNAVTIKGILMYGDISSSPTISASASYANIFGDDNVLPKNNIINVFTMTSDEKTIVRNINNIVIDYVTPEINSNNYYTLNKDSSIFIEPNVSVSYRSSSKYVNVKAMYLEYDSISNINLSMSIIKLSLDNGNKIANLNFDTDEDRSLFWSAGSVLALFNNPLQNANYVYSTFSILPKYKTENFETLPKYMESKFDNDYYDHYYNPVSELTQYPIGF